nr:MAG TPA: hypothetical protein [Crassvirales sp.]DAP79197.1 MAG TPA: hypothetical protein [Caudoviricetes sp.]
MSIFINYRFFCRSTLLFFFFLSCYLFFAISTY